MFFPPESQDSSKVLLVYDGAAAGAAKDAAGRQKVLGDVETELLSVVKSLDNIKSETLTIEKKWHDAIKGKNGSTLNRCVLVLLVGVNGY